jgi:hypothetical protein
VSAKNTSGNMPPPSDQAIRLTDTEALLAADVVYLLGELQHMRYVLGSLVQDVYGRQSASGVAFSFLLYPNRLGNGTPASVARHPPVGRLEAMVKGRSLAQAMGGKEEAAPLLATIRGRPE